MILTTEQPHGLVRQASDIRLKYDHPSHKSQYDKVGNFVQSYIQRQMVDTYGLEEVMIPENQHIPEELHSKPKCNIFMSPEFRTPDVENNRGKRALVLIQGSGAVRAGMW